MMTLMPDMPGDVVAVRITEKVRGEDYENVLMPAVDKAHKEHGKIKCLVHIDEGFTGYSAAALWDDTKIGLQHFTHFSKCAVVTDSEFVRIATKMSGWLLPGEVKLYSNAELADAVQWIRS